MRDEIHLEPAKSVIAKIGIEKVAEITGKHVSRIYRWRLPKTRGGTDGRIPHEEAETLLAFARANGIDLKPDDFFLMKEATQ